MIFRQLTEDNDWTFGKGKNNFAITEKAIQLDVKTRIQEWLNDCFFNMTVGIDWLNRLDRNQKQNLENEIKITILKTNNITGILNFSSSFVNRVFRANYQIQTIYSKTFADRIEVNI